MSEVDDGREPLLEVRDLETHYPITEGLLRREVGRVRAVDGVSFDVDKGEALGLVGESGSGKTTAALSILRLVEPTAGEIVFDGDSVTDLSGSDLRAFRRRAQLIVQDPNEAFSPRMTIGDAVEEPLLLHGMYDGDRRRAIAEDILERVGLSPDDADRFPHEFSGGEKQRIAIARALVLNPDLIIADEPTSALDGRVQADVLGLLDEVRREFDIAVLFISHDIDVVRRFCDDVAVMYLGEIVEKGPVDEVIAEPAHPYTRVLFGSVPSLDPRDRTLVRPLTDTIPDPADPPPGCRFHTRCPEVIPPADVDLDRSDWQSIARFRFTLEARELPEEIDVTVTDETVDRESVRATFDLPDPIDDESIERVVETAVGSIVDGDIEGAIEAVSGAITTPCERSAPTTVHRDASTIACHRYDPASDAEPLPWPVEAPKAGVEDAD
ncbi:MAG: ABC transporter ATP-binding protein [Halobacteriota archaeon]